MAQRDPDLTDSASNAEPCESPQSDIIADALDIDQFDLNLELLDNSDASPHPSWESRYKLLRKKYKLLLDNFQVLQTKYEEAIQLLSHDNHNKINCIDSNNHNIENFDHNVDINNDKENDFDFEQVMGNMNSILSTMNNIKQTVNENIVKNINSVPNSIDDIDINDHDHECKESYRYVDNFDENSNYSDMTKKHVLHLTSSKLSGVSDDYNYQYDDSSNEYDDDLGSNINSIDTSDDNHDNLNIENEFEMYFNDKINNSKDMLKLKNQLNSVKSQNTKLEKLSN